MPMFTLRAACTAANRNLQRRCCLLVLLAACMEAASAQNTAPASSISYTSAAFTLPPDIESMLSVDLNADARPDLLALHKDSVSVYLQQSGGSFDFTAPSASIAVQGAGMGWDIVDFRAPGSEQPQPRLMALVDGRSIVAWDFIDSTLSGPTTILDGLAGYLPKGLLRLRFARDLNDDGRMDFVVPGAEQLHLYLQDAAGGFGSSTSVQSNHYNQTRLSNTFLNGRIGQSLVIPLMELRDLNNDGVNDLISRTEERIDVYYSQAGAAAPTYTATPVYSVDLKALQAGMDNFSLDQLDFSNLTATLALTYNVLLNDVTNDGIDDVVIREGGKISLFTSTANGIDFQQPQQVLRSSGNVLGAYVRDENGDGLGDLWLARVEAISIGDLFVWLALSGTLEVEVFIYRNEGAQFTRRPSRKLTVAVKYPSALSLLGSGLQMQRTMDGAEAASARPSTLSDINRNTLDEMVVLMQDRLEIFFDHETAEKQKAAEDLQRLTPQQRQQQEEQALLAFLGYRQDLDAYEIDIRKIMDEVMTKATASTGQLASRSADLQVPLGTTTDNGGVFAVDLNQDGSDDFVVFLDGDDERITGVLLVSDSD